MSKAGGPHFPLRCCPEVLTWLVLPQNGHFITNVLARPYRTSSVTLQKESGPKMIQVE